ncbi:MAG: hypothetical protein ACXVQY_06620 [Actinomycetota bacterium]
MEINWDHPLTDSISTTASSLQQTPSAFGLSFSPTIPSFSGALKAIDVSDPKLVPAETRSLAIVFDFKGDSRFSGDARVIVTEAPEAPGEADRLVQMANDSQFPGSSLQATGSAKVLLLQANGIGRALWVENGVEYNVTGPAVSPDVALALAGDLIRQIG